MSLFELQEWLRHRMPSSTQRYAKITPTKLMKSYSNAGYFSWNLRAIEVLIDQEKVRSGVGVGEAWKFYDLGHSCRVSAYADCCQAAFLVLPFDVESGAVPWIVFGIIVQSPLNWQ